MIRQELLTIFQERKEETWGPEGIENGKKQSPSALQEVDSTDLVGGEDVGGVVSLRFLTLATAQTVVSFPEMGNSGGEVGGKIRTTIWAVLSFRCQNAQTSLGLDSDQKGLVCVVRPEAAQGLALYAQFFFFSSWSSILAWECFQLHILHPWHVDFVMLVRSVWPQCGGDTGFVFPPKNESLWRGIHSLPDHEVCTLRTLYSLGNSNFLP